MKCTKCGNEVAEGSKFCSVCGTPVASAKFCPQCGTKCGSNDLFCQSCGYSFKQASAPTATPPPATPTPPVPTATPAPVAAKPAAEAAPAETGSSSFRKHVTVLCVDIKGSTDMIHNLDPEEAKELISPAVEKMGSLVVQYGGLVINKAGDGLIATFGAPVAIEDHALRACLTALAMQKQVKQINSRLSIRVGLCSGEVLFSGDPSKYEVIGDAVNLATRMQEVTAPDTIGVPNETLKLVMTSVAYDSVGVKELKGGQKTEVFEIKGIKTSQSVKEFTNQFIGCVKYVNREAELARVKSLLEAAKAGNGNALSLAAESGIGKSRFMYEIVTSEVAKDCAVLLTAAFTHTRDIPLMPVANLFAGLFDLSRSETDIEKLKPKIAPFLTKVNSPFSLNAALSLINLAPKDPDWSALEPTIRRKYTFDVGVQLLINYALQKPLILILEDFHWVDSETELFFDALLSQIGKQKIFVTISYRPEYRDHWINKPSYSSLRLNPLGEEYQMQMLDHLLGKDASLLPIKKRLLGVVGGNPFFLEELIGSVISQKVFQGEPQNYRLAPGTEISKLHLPETVVNIYQIKIEKLPPLEKKILQVASIIGTKFLYSTLTELLDTVDDVEMRAAINRLIEQQYLYETQLYPEPGFGFIHALTQETAYNSILKKTRKSLHLKLFQLLETHLKDNEVESLQIVADQAYLSESWEKAVTYCVKAAEIVYELLALTTCAKLYEKALSASEHLPQTDEITNKVMRFHYELYYTYVPLGRFKEQYDHLSKALLIALSKKDRFFESILQSALGIYFAGFQNSNEALKHAQDALKIAIELNSVPATAIAQFTLVHILLFLAQLKELFAIYHDFEKLIQNIDYRTEWLKAPIGHIGRCYESWGRSHTGDFALVEARKEGWTTVTKNLHPLMAKFGALGMNAYLQGDFEKAVDYTSTALQHAMNTETIIFASIFCGILGNIFVRQGKIPEGKEHMERAMQMIEQVHAIFTTLFAMSLIADTLLQLNEVAQAEEYCENALTTVKERGFNLEYCLLLRVSAEIDLRAKSFKPESVKKKIDEVLGLVTQNGMTPHIAHCNITLANYYKKLGDAQNAQTALQNALTIYDKLGMKYWAQQAKL